MAVGLLLVSAASHAAQLADLRFGLDGVHKLGAPTLITATVAEANNADRLRLVAIAPDNDGLPVATYAELTAGGENRLAASVISKLGKRGGVVRLLLLDEGKTVDERRLRAGSAIGDTIINEPAAADERLTLAIGGERSLALPGTKTSHVALANAPTNWRGYLAVDRVLLIGSDLTAPSGDAAPAFAALETWVRRGGRLILSAGREAGPLLAPGGLLAAFAPGVPVEPVALRSAASLEAFAGANDRLDPNAPIAACRLTNVRGQVLAYDGPTRETLPLVVRTPLGFGEVVFLAVDLDQPSIAEWPGRDQLLARLIEPTATEKLDPAATGRRSQRGNRASVSTALVKLLDAALPGVGATPLLAIIGLAVLYLLAIGPLDWLIVTRCAERPQLTWVTFPLMALAGLAVVLAALWTTRGANAVVASFEIRDVECGSGATRQLVLSQMYTPRPDRFDLTPAGFTDAATIDTTWLAATDGRLGGLASASGLGDAAAGGYTLSGDGRVEGLPIAGGSTKPLATSAYGQTEATIEADLRPGMGGLIEGSVSNTSGTDLEEAQLWHNGWAWRLGDFRAGQTKAISDAGNLLRVTTLLGQQLDQREATPKLLAAAISFGDLMRRRRDPPPNHLLRHWDLTHQLDVGRAVLVGRLADTATAPSLRSESHLEGALQQREVLVRYLINVAE
ncbi:MAG: hypothetical protein AAFV43_00835 [Planctomycetota bacterium]